MDALKDWKAKGAMMNRRAPAVVREWHAERPFHVAYAPVRYDADAPGPYRVLAIP